MSTIWLSRCSSGRSSTTTACFSRRARAERQRRQGVPLHGGAGAREGLDEGGAGPRADDDLQSANRTKARPRRSPCGGSRSVRRSPRLPTPRRRRPWALIASASETIGSSTTGAVAVSEATRAGRQRVAQLFDEAAIEQDQTSGAELLASGQRAGRSLDRGPIGGGRERRRVGHGRAQVRVVPGFDAPRRQAAVGEALERGGAFGRPRQLAFAPRTGGRGSTSAAERGDGVSGHRTHTASSA